MPVDGCLHHPKRVHFAFRAVFLSKLRPELEGWISQSCRQCFRLHIISPILSATFAWFALCFCFQPTLLSLLFLNSTQLENGTLLVQAVFATEYCHLQQNAVVVLYRITQLAVFLFVEFVRPLRMPWSQWSMFLVYHLWKLAILIVNFRHFAEKTVEIFQNWHRGKYLQQRHYLKLQIPPFWKSPSRDRWVSFCYYSDCWI